LYVLTAGRVFAHIDCHLAVQERITDIFLFLDDFFSEDSDKAFVPNSVQKTKKKIKCTSNSEPLISVPLAKQVFYSSLENSEFPTILTRILHEDSPCHSHMNALKILGSFCRHSELISKYIVQL